MNNICVIEDDNSVNELICVTLKSAGFNVKSYLSGEDFFDEDKKFDLFLLDVMLPGMSGFDIFTKLKQNGEDAAVIFLTAKVTELDRVYGIDLGADDYITKPFMVLELIARVKAVLRRKGANKDFLLKIGKIAINDVEHTVIVNEEKIELTYKEFEMLKYFMKNIHKVITREVLLNNVWGIDAQIETRTIDMHIKTLRQKLNAGGVYIKTVRGVGYKFEVEQ